MAGLERHDGKDFRPPPWLRNGHVQTVLSSSRLRTLGANPMVEASRQTIVDAGDGVRLLGLHAAHAAPTGKGLMILLHGWEGSADSSYLLSSGRFFFREGFDVFRLNFRDHGGTHHLNEGLFHGALLDEVFTAIRRIAALAADRPCYLLGFSLGGNFALRVARRHGDAPIANLRQVFAVSPPLDPYVATRRIDEGPALYRRYFLRKWKRSLRKKQALFPGRYDFRAALRLHRCLDMTEAILPSCPEFRDYRDYFRRYTLTNALLRDVSLPATIIAAEDDPVVPATEARNVVGGRNLRVSIQPYGGHCGFIAGLSRASWADRVVRQTIREDPLAPPPLSL